MAALMVYKVKAVFENNEAGEPAHADMVISVTRTGWIKTIQDAVNYCMEVVGPDENGKPITRIHHRDNNSFYNLISCEPVSDKPFMESFTPTVGGLHPKVTSQVEMP